MNITWYRYEQTRPTSRGDYLVLYGDEADGTELTADVATFYPQGALLGSLPSDIEGTAEERLLDSIFNRPITAYKPGFYSCDLDEERYWELKPLFWASLPEAPQGYQYTAI